jgi:glycosyltransferase involved in cell wall biosynthesis
MWSWKVMTRREIVSIVIPAYNAEQFIGDSVKSCFSQTYRPIEIIVVNDGSKDATVNVVESLSDLIPDNNVELRLVDVHENKGAANALNSGFSTAKGDYICWLSADDLYIDKEKIQCQLESMNKKKSHGVISEIHT